MYRSSPEELKRIDEDNRRRIFEDELQPEQIIILKNSRPDPDEMRLEDYPEWMHTFILRARENKTDRLKTDAVRRDHPTAAD